MSEQSLEKLLAMLFRVACVGCTIALPILAWLPAKAMTRSALGGHVEHFVAYLATATIVGLAFQKRPHLALQCALIIAYAAILEVGQLYSPGRHASFRDFAFSASGVVVGGLFLWLVRARLSTWLKLS